MTALDPGMEAVRTPGFGRTMVRATLTPAAGATSPLPIWRLGSSSTPLVVLDAAALTVAVLSTGAALPQSLVWIAAVLLFAAFCGSYRGSITPTLRSAAPPLVCATVASALAVVEVHPAYAGSFRTLIPAAGLLLVVGRASAYWLQGAARARNKLATLIIGAGEIGCKLAETIKEHPSSGLDVVGIVDEYDTPMHPCSTGVIGRLADLGRLIDTHEVRRVIIAFGARREPEMVDVLRACKRRNLDVFILPRLFELGVGGGPSSGDELWGFPLTRISPGAMPGPSWVAKRLVDVIMSAVALVLLSPVFAVAAIGVKLTSRGPVFFKQPRVGQRGRTVDVLKFRSMPTIADSATRWHVDEASIHWFGRLLRRTSIDELPQLLNVLRGDMSLVGPRPEREHYVSKFTNEIARYGARHRVPVGLTGWAQVHGLRGDTSIEDRARFDNYYIEHWSVWLDLVILARTIGHVVKTVVGWTHTTTGDAPSPGTGSAKPAVDRVGPPNSVPLPLPET